MQNFSQIIDISDQSDDTLPKLTGMNALGRTTNLSQFTLKKTITSRNLLE